MNRGLAVATLIVPLAAVQAAPDVASLKMPVIGLPIGARWGEP